MRIMFVGAHPDDIELGCGGTLLKHIERGDSIVYVVLTRGERGGDPRERMTEVRRIIEWLGIKDYYLLDFPDTRLHEYFNDVKDALEDLIGRFKPDRIYTHSLNDLHQDHYTAAYATLVAGRRVGQILHYWSPTTYNNFHPVYFIDITDVIKRKMELLKLYASQNNIDYLKKQVTEGINKYFGYLAGVEYAEGYELRKFVENWVSWRYYYNDARRSICDTSV